MFGLAEGDHSNKDKMQEKIETIYNKKQKLAVSKSLVKDDFLPTIYEVSPPSPNIMKPSIEPLLNMQTVEGYNGTGSESEDNSDSESGSESESETEEFSTYGIDDSESETEEFSTYGIEGMKNKKKKSKGRQNNSKSKSNKKRSKKSRSNKKKSDKKKSNGLNPQKMLQSIFPIRSIQKNMTSGFKEFSKVLGYNDKNNLPPNKKENDIWNENGALLQNLVFEFMLVFISYIITYNIYYFAFIYNWEVQTAHYDPKQGFLFGGVFKSIMDDWLMRDIRYPMLFMSYLYSWLIPSFFNLIGVIHYPKLCFIIILLHTMIITFTQGPNAAMSVESLLGGSPSSMILMLNMASCLSALFNTSMTAENALAWMRFVALWLPSCIANLIRFLIAFFGVFISQFMVYFFFLYTTSGFGLLWEAQFFGIGEKIQEINAHIGGKTGVGKNYCKMNKKNTDGLWEFINQQIEPHFSWLFIYLLLLYVIVKTITIFIRYNGAWGKAFACFFLFILGIIIWLISNSMSMANDAANAALNTVFVSNKDPEKSMFEKAKEGVANMSEFRKRTLTNLSNQGDNFLSKTVGQTGRNLTNAISNNTLLGDDTFTVLDKADKSNLQEITTQLNTIMNNIDSAKDYASNGLETKQAEGDIKELLTNNKDVYQILENVFKQPKIQEYINKKVGEGKDMTTILPSLFQYILSRSGANPKVTSLVSSILPSMYSGLEPVPTTELLSSSSDLLSNEENKKHTINNIQ